MYTKIDLNKPSVQSPGKGGNKKDQVIFIDVDDLTSEAARDSKGVLITGNHVFKEGAYAVKVYGTIDTLSGKITSEGDIDAEGFKAEYVFSHPGSALEKLEFESAWINKSIIIIQENCSDGTKKQYGSKCAPLRMKVEAMDDKDSNKSTFTFTSSVKGPNVAIYQGTITLSAPVDTVDADDTTIDLAAGEGEYQLTDNSGATVITTCTNAVDGMVFTLLGSGGTNPSSITKANDFVLKDGTTWNGLANAKITFKAFKSDAAAWKFFELSRQ
jgi:hypothetical protein